jgi:hypothetical protein
MVFCWILCFQVMARRRGIKLSMVWSCSRRESYGGSATARPYVHGGILGSRESNHKPQSPEGRCKYRWVADLLLPDGSWNLQRLEQYFSDENVKEIMQIKPSRRNENDFISWFPEKTGMFTVRSAYRLALHRDMMQQDCGATSSRQDGVRPSWRLIWKCPVPPKVQTLAWKICCNAIATQVNMFRRGMATTGICQIRGREEEDSLHTFLRAHMPMRYGMQ